MSSQYYKETLTYLSDSLDRVLNKEIIQDSSKWEVGYSGKSHHKNRLYELLTIRDTVRNLLLVHGLPKECPVELADLESFGMGCAMFDDIGVWKKPKIYLDAGVFERLSQDKVLDVYCGVGLHEASHILNTRYHYKRLKDGAYSPVEKLYIGLLEDERIERELVKTSPGFQDYITISKRELFEKDDVGVILQRWSQESLDPLMVPCSDYTKLTSLSFAYIRSAYLITEEMKTWKTLTGSCPFEEFCKAVPRLPIDELEVEKFGLAIAYYVLDETRRLADMKDSEAATAAEVLALEKLKQEQQKQEQQKLQSNGPTGVQGQSGSQSSRSGSPTTEQPSTPPNEPPSINAPGQPGAGGGISAPDDGSEASASQPEIDNGIPGAGGSPGGSAPPDSSATNSPDVAGSPSATDSPERVGELPSTTEQKDSNQLDPTELAKNRLKANEEELLRDDVETIKKHTDNLKSLIDAYTKAASKTDVSEHESNSKLKNLEEKIEKEHDLFMGLLKKRIKEGRFTLQDLKHMVDNLDLTRNCLTVGESFNLAQMENERWQLSQDWKPEGTSNPTRTFLIHPQVTEQRKSKYLRALQSIKNDIAAMQQAFRQIRVGKRDFSERELIEGRLDRKMLGKAAVTDKIFKRNYTKVETGIAIALLLDESGSMRSSTKDSNCLKAAICMVEAVQKIQGIELEVYSFTSDYGNGVDTNRMQYLHGKDNPQLHSIGAYGEKMDGNFDYMALATANRLLKEKTQQKNKLIIIISDGAPCGCLGEYDAETLVKKEVTKIRKSGTHVIQIAIEDRMNSEAMYGKENVLHFTDMSKLVVDMKRLFLRIIKSVSGTRK
jgi:hypothetical protein